MVCCNDMVKQKLASYDAHRTNDGTWGVYQKETHWCVNCGTLHFSYQKEPYGDFVQDMQKPGDAV